MRPLSSRKRLLDKKTAAPLAVFLLVASELHAEQIWKPLPPLPEPVGGAICASVGNSILVVGGTNWPAGEKKWVKTIRVFTPHSASWSLAGELSSPRAYGVKAVVGNALLVGGGSDGVRSHRALLRMVPNKPWSVSPALSQDFVYASGGLLGEELVLAGGATDQADLSTFTNAAVAVHTTTLKERPLPPLPGPASGIAASAVCANRLYIFGGAYWDKAKGSVANLATTLVLSTQPDAWSQAAHYPFEMRGATALPLDDRHIYIGGGFRSSPEGFTDEAFLYDTCENRFRAAPPLPLRGMTHLVNHGGTIYCIGGEDRKQHRSDGLWMASTADLLKAETVR